MTWALVAALVAVAAMLVLPSRDRARLRLLTQRGRLGSPNTDPAVEPPAARHSRMPGFGLLLTTGLAVCCVIGVLATAVVGFEAAMVLGVVGLLVRDIRRTREDVARLADFRVAIGLLIGELQAGSTPPAALDAAAAMSTRLAGALESAARVAAQGHDAAGLLCESDDRDVRRLGVVWRVGESTGVPLREVLERLIADLDSAADQRRSVSVVLAGPRSSAALLCALPILGVALGAAMGARPIPLLFGTSAGQLLCCVGLALDALGVLWVRRILLRAGAE